MGSEGTGVRQEVPFVDTGIILIISLIALLVIVAVIAFVARSSLLPGRRTARLKKRFGPEYDRAVRAHGDAGAAERDLSERLRRREGMSIRDLTDQERRAHADAWAAIQQEFVDAPVQAVQDARLTVGAIMADRGYPAPPAPADTDEGFEHRLRDLSVDHPTAVAGLRRTQDAGRLAESDESRTEYLREALVAYRDLVGALLGGPPAVDGTVGAAGARTSVPGHHPERRTEEGR
mgnify:CR=1 FL=1